MMVKARSCVSQVSTPREGDTGGTPLLSYACRVYETDRGKLSEEVARFRMGLYCEDKAAKMPQE